MSSRPTTPTNDGTSQMTAPPPSLVCASLALTRLATDSGAKRHKRVRSVDGDARSGEPLTKRPAAVREQHGRGGRDNTPERLAISNGEDDDARSKTTVPLSPGSLIISDDYETPSMPVAEPPMQLAPQQPPQQQLAQPPQQQLAPRQWMLTHPTPAPVGYVTIPTTPLHRYAAPPGAASQASTTHPAPSAQQASSSLETVAAAQAQPTSRNSSEFAQAMDLYAPLPVPSSFERDIVFWTRLADHMKSRWSTVGRYLGHVSTLEGMITYWSRVIKANDKLRHLRPAETYVQSAFHAALHHCKTYVLVRTTNNLLALWALGRTGSPSDRFPVPLTFHDLARNVSRDGLLPNARPLSIGDYVPVVNNRRYASVSVVSQADGTACRIARLELFTETHGEKVFLLDYDNQTLLEGAPYHLPASTTSSHDERNSFVFVKVGGVEPKSHPLGKFDHYVFERAHDVTDFLLETVERCQCARAALI